VSTTEQKMRTIFRSEAVIVSVPFIDGARIELRDLGCYTSLDAVIAWIRGRDFRDELSLDEETAKLLVVQGVERAVDVGPRARECREKPGPDAWREKLEPPASNRSTLSEPPRSKRGAPVCLPKRTMGGGCTVSKSHVPRRPEVEFRSHV
jgi:hypothetical protein